MLFPLYFILLIGSLGLNAAPLELGVQSESAILINAQSGAILYEKDAYTQQYPASITKIATGIYTLETAFDQLLAKVEADQEALGTVSEEVKKRSSYSQPSYRLVHDATHISIKPGEQLLLKDLLIAMLVKSANDAANVIAMSVGGTIPQFMDCVNSYLQQIGCTQTYFNNPHGLHHPKHVTTAYDMALLTRKALQNPTFRKIVSTKRCTRPKTNKQEASILVQTNRLLKPGKYFYPKAIGVKTGYTASAQRTLVAAATYEERTLIAVLLKCKDRDGVFQDAINLFEAAFNEPKVKKTLLKAGTTKYIYSPDGAAKSISTYILEPVAIEFFPAEEPHLTASLNWTAGSFPIEKDQVVGEIQIETKEGHLLHTVPLLAEESVSATWGHWFKSFFIGN